jgi:hypothetical protein
MGELPVATAESKLGTEVFAFKVGDDGKSISVLRASQVTYGISDADQIPIVSESGNTIVASKIYPLGVTTIILGHEDAQSRPILYIPRLGCFRTVIPAAVHIGSP